MTSSSTTTGRGPGGAPGPERSRPRRHRRHVGRDARVSTKVGESAFRRSDERAARAGLSLGSWMVLLADDVVARRPVVGESVLDDLGDARVRVARIGAAINAMAVKENQGGAVAEGQLREVLDRLAARTAQASGAVWAAGEVFRTAVPAAGCPVGPVDPAVGRRAKDEAGRGRQIRAQLTAGERDVLVASAALEGLAVGAWLGRLLEDPGAIRPLRGEVYGAVVALRRALRRVGTNLAQIEEARARRGAPAPVGVVGARGQVDAAIRACLDTQATISGQRGTGSGA